VSLGHFEWVFGSVWVGACSSIGQILMFIKCYYISQCIIILVILNVQSGLKNMYKPAKYIVTSFAATLIFGSGMLGKSPIDFW